MRHEWTGTAEQALYVARGDDGLIDTNAGPDDLEAHEELLRLAERVRELEAERAAGVKKRIRRELLEAIGEADARSRRSLSAFHGSLSAEALRVLRTNIETAVDKIVPAED